MHTYLRNHNQNFNKFSVHVPCGRGSFLLQRRCNMSRTSGFVNDVMFSHNQFHGDVTLQKTHYEVVNRLTPMLRVTGCVLS